MARPVLSCSADAAAALPHHHAVCSVTNTPAWASAPMLKTPLSVHAERAALVTNVELCVKTLWLLARAQGVWLHVGIQVYMFTCDEYGASLYIL